MAAPTADEIQLAMQGVQDHITTWLVEATGGEKYHEDLWQYTKGSGGGRSRLWEGGPTKVLEKGGVNFSMIEGTQLPMSSTGVPLVGGNMNDGFKATGVSLVIHPRNPNVPTIHMNVRYFETGDKWWFGGGIDLTPYYPVFSQVQEFHRRLKAICDEHQQPYDDYKQQCDVYFTLKHRKEMRGIGGIFFDRLSASDDGKMTKASLLHFVTDLGKAFTALYAPFLLGNNDLPWTPVQREYQIWRRSRYVEFNLLFDRGTKFGIDSEGRTESILMSLPTVAKWYYNFFPSAGTAENIVHTFYLHPQDWLTLKPEAVPHVTNNSSDFQRFVDEAAGSKCCPPTIAVSLLIGGFLAGVGATFAVLALKKKN